MLPDTFDRDAFIADLRFKHSRILLPNLPMSVEVEDGWLPLLDDTLTEIEACLEKHRWIGRASIVRVKEKFGGLRIYVRPNNASIHIPKMLQIELTDIRDEAERRSMQTCELCGDPAEVGNYDGYYQSLCQRHSHERLGWLAAGRPGNPFEFAKSNADEIEQAIAEFLQTGELPAAWAARFDHLTATSRQAAITKAKFYIAKIAIERARGDQNAGGGQ